MFLLMIAQLCSQTLKFYRLGFFDSSHFNYHYEETRYNFPERLAPAQNVQFQFPQLTNLTLNNDCKQRTLQFSPQMVSSSLEKVFLNVSLNDLVLFCKLSIHSISRLTLILSLDGLQNMEEFYRSTDQLLGEIDNFRNYTLFDLGERFDLVDIKRIHWDNVTDLRLHGVDSFALMELLDKLLSLRSIRLDPFIYTSNYSSLGQSNSQLKKIEIFRLKRNEWTLDDVVEFLCCLMRHHPNVGKLILPKDLKNRAKQMFKGTQWQHVELTKTKDWIFIW